MQSNDLWKLSSQIISQISIFEEMTLEEMIEINLLDTINHFPIEFRKTH